MEALESLLSSPSLVPSGTGASIGALGLLQVGGAIGALGDCHHCAICRGVFFAAGAASRDSISTSAGMGANLNVVDTEESCAVLLPAHRLLFLLELDFTLLRVLLAILPLQLIFFPSRSSGLPRNTSASAHRALSRHRWSALSFLRSELMSTNSFRTFASSFSS